MIPDRYTKIVLTVLAVALMAVAANPWIAPHGWRAAMTIGAAEAQQPAVSIPKNFGKVVGFSDEYIFLEASDGTLRRVKIYFLMGDPNRPKAELDLTINRG